MESALFRVSLALCLVNADSEIDSGGLIMEVESERRPWRRASSAAGRLFGRPAFQDAVEKIVLDASVRQVLTLSLAMAWRGAPQADHRYKLTAELTAAAASEALGGP
jgi:hypothetical protein